MSNSRRIAVIVCLLPAMVFACLWDSDTIRDEVQARPSLLELVTGRLPHHGTDYYETRVKRLEPKNDRSPKETNDLAVALIRLARFDAAQVLLEAQLTDEPDSYITLSNLGVLHKKQGDFARGADYIRKALGIKPEGHMGLGDWYEKALTWRAQCTTNTSPPKVDFLGEAYDEIKSPINHNFRPLTAERKKRFDKLQNLLRNDQSFADGFLVMGDFLVMIGDLHLGTISYYRSLQLQHPNPGMVNRRINMVENHWREGSLRSDKWTSRDKAEKLISAGKIWVVNFQMKESVLVALGEMPDFKTVQATMTDSKRELPLLDPKIFPEAEKGSPFLSPGTYILAAGMAGLIALGAVIFWLRSKWKR
ncbi:MAG: hypothetical protein P8M70_04160 [Verrucomicrobiota bacterium]|nr:hypothetical protein [Verrucomicrobiota bacterium]